MNKEVQSIQRNLENVLEGTPWYGQPVIPALSSIDEKKVYVKPNGVGHSMAELLYHCINWAEFVLKRLEGDSIQDLKAFEENDWIKIDPRVHQWKEGLTRFRSIHEKIIQLLDDKNDQFLKEIVDYRQYNFRFMLNGLSQHNIYHLGQMLYIDKFIVSDL